ncbi:MAG: M48 family metallopeptidase [Acidobacteriota bacterium]
MQLSLPWAEPVVPGIQFVRHRRARRYILRVLPDGTLRVTLPRGGVKREARAFVAASAPWIELQRSRAAGRKAETAWAHGSEVLVEGRPSVLRIEHGPSSVCIWCGDALVVSQPDPEVEIRQAVEGWLEMRARRELPPLLRALAAAHGIEVQRVSVRNQRSRWGACSPSGTITLNWRLIQAPGFVRDYVMLHELMHRRELNHSRRFWRLVAACCPRHAEARRWLRQEGKSLWRDGV